MELQEFVSKVLTDITSAIDKMGDNKYRINMPYPQQNGNVEFDIAVTAESNLAGEGKAGIKVWELVEARGGVKGQITNSTVSRIKFAVSIDSESKEERERESQQIAHYNRNAISDLS